MVTLRRCPLRMKAWQFTTTASENTFVVSTGFSEVVGAVLLAGQSGKAWQGRVSGFVLDDNFGTGSVIVSGVRESDTGTLVAFGLS